MSQRDEKLRHSLLTAARILGSNAQNGMVSSTALVQQARDDQQRPVDDDSHAARLLDDLIAYGLIEEDRPQHLTTAAREFRHRRFRLSKKGFSLWMGDIQPVPGVWDERLES